MNADFFGLKRPPFRGGRIYPGPQQLALAGGLKRSLVAPDSVFAVTGAVGVGKSASVQHALDRLECQKLVVRLGRAHVERRDVLEMLLDRFDVDPKPASASRRLDALNQLFHAQASRGVQVFIIVEDAERFGPDPLAELESLTAADGGHSPGAHLVLLGPPGLEAFLDTPVLARLKQRMRRRMDLVAFTEAETRRYIEYAVQEAGGVMADVFDDAAIRVIYRCTGGVARLINAMCEAILFAASEAGADRVDEALALAVAADDFGYRPDAGEPPVTTPDTVTATDDGADPDLFEETQTDLPRFARRRGQRPATDTAPVDPLEPRAPRPFTRDSDPADSQTIRALDDALRPDTQLLQSLNDPITAIADDAPVPLGLREPLRHARPDPDQTIADEDLPTLSPEIDFDDVDIDEAENGEEPSVTVATAVGAAAHPPEPVGSKEPEPPVPADAAKSAMAAAGPAGETTAAAATPPSAGDPWPDEQADAGVPTGDGPRDTAKDAERPGVSRLPEITLDASLSEHQKEAQSKLAEEAAKIAATSKSAAGAEETPAADDAPATEENERQRRMQMLSARFSEAKSLEDVLDDTAAETLFGEEFSQLAATVSAMGPAMSPAVTRDAAASTEAANAEFPAAASGTDSSQPLTLEAEEPAAAAPPAPAEPAIPGAAVQAAAKPAARSAGSPPAPAGTTSDRPSDRAAAVPATNGSQAPDAAPMNGNAARPNGTATPAPRPGVMSSSAAQRLEMVRALNQKAGKPVPRMPAGIGEEIVLGDDTVPNGNGTGKPEPIENQFGVSMTASLRALSAENIRKMQQEEAEAEKPEKKGGLLSRFRRS